jgi:Ca2+-dependent lipid-binding protein
MNVPKVKSTIKEYEERTPKNTLLKVDDDYLFSGMLKVQVIQAENLKSCTKNGTSNPYVVLRIQDQNRTSRSQKRGSATSDSSQQSQTNLTNLASSFLAANKNELVRTRVVYDTLNPTWGETFQVLLPPVDKISVFMYSKNLLTSDDIAGQGLINLGRGSSLRDRQADHQTQNVVIELEPQGALLVRLTDEGQEEDIEFWFRKTREHLKRTREDFLRVWTSKVKLKFLQRCMYA